MEGVSPVMKVKVEDILIVAPIYDFAFKTLLQENFHRGNSAFNRVAKDMGWINQNVLRIRE
jgi:hypothetical protein